MKLVAATRNRGKLKEIKEILDGTGIELLSLDEFPDISLPPETGGSFKENALLKARKVARETGLPALSDDSGLEVDGLRGRPGVRSARYAGNGAADEENIRKLLYELKRFPPGSPQRSARFRCVIALVTPQGREEVFEGTLEGTIAERPSGSGGFGYDPVFYIPEEERTAAELSPEEKNRISHRAKALGKLKMWLQQNKGALA